MNISPDSLLQPTAPKLQRTLKTAIHCRGVGLHSGVVTRLDLLPAPEGHGIVFRRQDLGIAIPARFDHVADTRLCTVLQAPDHPSARIGTVEHVMAALAARGLTNVVVALDGPEMPVLDGSAEPFLFLLDAAGIRQQAAAAPVIEVLRTIRVERGDAFVELRPNPVDALDLSLSIAFAAPAIGEQALSVRLDETVFRADLARARTFTLQSEIEALHQAGLARGGSLDNAVVVAHDHVLNPGGLRYRDEFVRHKMLDLIGDLALGGVLRAKVVAHRTGHALNNEVLRALFADPTAWRVATPNSVGAGTPMTGRWVTTLSNAA